jgi:hypothetical protein
MGGPITTGRMLRASIHAGLAAALALGVGAVQAAADVTITSKITFDGVGAQGWGARGGKSVMVVAADKARRENDTMPAGGGGSPGRGSGARHAALITRLDKGGIIHVDYVAKNYWERTFEDMKKNLAESLNSMGEEGGGQTEEAKDGHRVTWQPLRFDIQHTDAKETINTFPCEETVITAATDGENAETGQTCSLKLTVDLWVTPRTAALDDLAAFRRRQVEILGIDTEQSDLIGPMGRGLGDSGNQAVSDVTAQIDKVPGYPIRTRLTLDKAGDCGPARGGPLRNMMLARRQARRGAAGGEASDGGFKKVFGLTREVVSIETGPAPAGTFDAPADFARTDPPQRNAKKG